MKIVFRKKTAISSQKQRNFERNCAALWLSATKNIHWEMTRQKWEKKCLRTIEQFMQTILLFSFAVFQYINRAALESSFSRRDTCFPKMSARKVKQATKIFDIFRNIQDLSVEIFQNDFTAQTLSVHKFCDFARKLPKTSPGWNLFPSLQTWPLAVYW